MKNKQIKKILLITLAILLLSVIFMIIIKNKKTEETKPPAEIITTEKLKLSDEEIIKIVKSNILEEENIILKITDKKENIYIVSKTKEEKEINRYEVDPYTGDILLTIETEVVEYGGE